MATPDVPAAARALIKVMTEQITDLEHLQAHEAQRRDELRANLMADLEQTNDRAVELSIRIQQTERTRIQATDTLAKALGVSEFGRLQDLLPHIPLELRKEVHETGEKLRSALAQVQSIIIQNGRMIHDSLELARMVMDAAGGRPQGRLTYGGSERSSVMPLNTNDLA